MDAYAGHELKSDDALLVFGQYGIAIEVASSRVLTLTAEQKLRFRDIATDCLWDQVSEEQDELFRLGREGVAGQEIVVYGVYWITPPRRDLAGCGSHRPGRPAALLSAVNVSRWTLAHELGHVLLGSGHWPVHAADTRNVMYNPTALISANPPGFSQRQLDAIRRSPYCTPAG